MYFIREIIYYDCSQRQTFNQLNNHRHSLSANNSSDFNESFHCFFSRERVFLMVLLGEIGNTPSNPHICISPIPAGAVHIRFLHFILAHYISAFKPVKGKK